MSEDTKSPHPEETPEQPAAEKPVQPNTRRKFICDIGKLIAMGVLSHFGLLAGKVNAGANDDWCPYGTPAEGDACNPGAENADVCLDGYPKQDECVGGSWEEDNCSSGEKPQDICPESGTWHDGDECWGGGSETNGNEQDACQPNGDGDQCTPGGIPGGGGHDVCAEGESERQDICSGMPWSWSDDTCYNGNGGGSPESGSGGDDWCWGNKWAYDICHDGSDAQDRCLGEETGFGDGDKCFSKNTDHCGVVMGDPDVCRTGMPSDDVCPGGEPPEDRCYSQSPGSDECPGGRQYEDTDSGGST
jgi:hypothetical protein